MTLSSTVARSSAEIRVLATWTRISKTLFLYARSSTTRLRSAVDSDTGPERFSSPKSSLNSAIGRMQVDVASKTRPRSCRETVGSSRNRSTNVPMTAASPSLTGAWGTGRSLIRTPLVDWLSYRTQAPSSFLR